MFNFDKQDVQRIAVSGFGAVALSAACLIAVAGPARAETAQTKSVKAAIEKQLDDGAPLSGSNTKVGEARVAVRFDDNGRYAGATLIKSSADAEFDKVAVHTARTLEYPAVTGGQTVVVRLLNGASQQRVAMERAKDATVRYADGSMGSAKVIVK